MAVITVRLYQILSSVIKVMSSFLTDHVFSTREGSISVMFVCLWKTTGPYPVMYHDRHKGGPLLFGQKDQIGRISQEGLVNKEPPSTHTHTHTHTHTRTGQSWVGTSPSCFLALPQERSITDGVLVSMLHNVNARLPYEICYYLKEKKKHYL